MLLQCNFNFHAQCIQQIRLTLKEVNLKIIVYFTLVQVLYRLRGLRKKKCRARKYLSHRILSFCAHPLRLSLDNDFVFLFIFVLLVPKILWGSSSQSSLWFSEIKWQTICRLFIEFEWTY